MPSEACGANGTVSQSSRHVSVEVGAGDFRKHVTPCEVDCSPLTVQLSLQRRCPSRACCSSIIVTQLPMGVHLQCEVDCSHDARSLLKGI
jgi:hypothetical protein